MSHEASGLSHAAGIPGTVQVQERKSANGRASCTPCEVPPLLSSDLASVPLLARDRQRPPLSSPRIFRKRGIHRSAALAATSDVQVQIDFRRLQEGIRQHGEQMVPSFGVQSVRGNDVVEQDDGGQRPAAGGLGAVTNTHSCHTPGTTFSSGRASQWQLRSVTQSFFIGFVGTEMNVDRN